MIDLASFLLGIYFGGLLGSIIVVIAWILDLKHIVARNRKTFTELLAKYEVES